MMLALIASSLRRMTADALLAQGGLIVMTRYEVPAPGDPRAALERRGLAQCSWHFARGHAGQRDGGEQGCVSSCASKRIILHRDVRSLLAVRMLQPRESVGNCFELHARPPPRPA